MGWNNMKIKISNIIISPVRLVCMPYWVFYTKGYLILGWPNWQEVKIFRTQNCVMLHFGHHWDESSWMWLVPNPQNIKLFTQQLSIKPQTNESSATPLWEPEIFWISSITFQGDKFTIHCKMCYYTLLILQPIQGIFMNHKLNQSLNNNKGQVRFIFAMSHSISVVSFQSDISFTKMAFLMCTRPLEISTRRLTYQSTRQTRPSQSNVSIVATSSADSSKPKIWAFSIIRDFVTDLEIVILPRWTWNHIDTYNLKPQKDFTMFHYSLPPPMYSSISKGHSHKVTHCSQSDIPKYFDPLLTWYLRRIWAGVFWYFSAIAFTFGSSSSW
jgi:hypothetical protein